MYMFFFCWGAARSPTSSYAVPASTANVSPTAMHRLHYPRLLNPDLPVYCVCAMCTQSSHKVGSGIKRVLQGAADVTLNVVDRAGRVT
jgi:hypothetical protein